MVKQPARKCNSYDAVRFIAATAVLISHHYPLSGRAEPVVPLLQTSLGGASVAIVNGGVKTGHGAEQKSATMAAA